jgi:hypothetical protein
MTPVLARKADALGLLEEEPLPDPMRISNVVRADGLGRVRLIPTRAPILTPSLYLPP